jgi:hypothetical protein
MMMKKIGPLQGGDIWDRLRIEYLFFPDKIDILYFLFLFYNTNSPLAGIRGQGTSILQHSTPPVSVVLLEKNNLI